MFSERVLIGRENSWNLDIKGKYRQPVCSQCHADAEDNHDYVMVYA